MSSSNDVDDRKQQEARAIQAQASEPNESLTLEEVVMRALSTAPTSTMPRPTLNLMSSPRLMMNNTATAKREQQQAELHDRILDDLFGTPPPSPKKDSKVTTTTNNNNTAASQSPLSTGFNEMLDLDEASSVVSATYDSPKRVKIGRMIRLSLPWFLRKTNTAKGEAE